MEPHRILREVFRHYLEFEALVSQTGVNVIEYGQYTISFYDLQSALAKLSKRKQEAILYNVIYDMKQKDVAEIMNITTVSVGQYVESGMIQVAKHYFAELEAKDV